MAPSRQWQLIRSWLRRTYNKEVHEFFKDIPADLDLDLDISTGRSATKAVCLIGANDSQGLASIKRENFRELKERAGLRPLPVHPFVALPEETVEIYPQVQLWFYERQGSAKSHNRRPLTVQISFRIKDENWKPADAKPLALKIKDAFAKPIYNFQTGPIKVNYKDRKKGYRFCLPMPSLEAGKNVLQDIFQLMGDTPDWKNLGKSEYEENYPANGETVYVYGKNIKKHSNRSGIRVYFRYAIAKVPNLLEDIPLVDTSQTYLNAFYHEANPYLVRETSPRKAHAKQLKLPLS